MAAVSTGTALTLTTVRHGEFHAARVCKQSCVIEIHLELRQRQRVADFLWRRQRFRRLHYSQQHSQ